MRTDRAIFYRKVTIDDGRNGQQDAGEMQVHTCQVEFHPLKAPRTLEAANLTLRPGARMLFWVDPKYAPQAGDLVECQGTRHAIQTIYFTDATKRKYELTGLAL